MKLPFDPQHAVDHLSESDRRLARLIQRAGPFTLQPQKMHSPFQALLRAIVYQQLSGKAAATIFSRVEALLVSDGQGIKPESILETHDDRLRGAGMSRGKVKAVKDLAAKTLDGTVPGLTRLAKMADAEILERLVQVRGIGPWSVEMLLMFRLGRPDVLPATDLGVRKGFMLTYGGAELPAPKALLAHGERWRPYRSVASWYLWRAVDLAAAGAGNAAPPSRSNCRAVKSPAKGTATSEKNGKSTVPGRVTTVADKASRQAARPKKRTTQRRAKS